MTEHDDDDEQLRALRAVWLAMPDEDPPERGLGELMAAARVKADEMARPAWWRRMFETLRRPPVLALATIMVLVAGAVLVGQRKDEMETAPPAGTSAPSAPSAPSAAPVAPPVGNPGEANTIVPADEAPPAAEPAKPLEKAPAMHRHEVPRAITAPPHKAALDTIRDPSAGEEQKPEPPRAPPAPKPMVLAKPPAADSASGAEAEPDFAKAKSGAAPSKSSGPALGQLLGQCRSAATRGDCAAARVLARRIAQQDASYYRDNVAGDSSISSCLSVSE